MLIHYVRQEKKNANEESVKYPIAVFIARPRGNYIDIGFAVCNPKDTFHKKLGKQIAIGRAEKHWGDTTFRIPERVAREFYEFLAYCLDHPKYKDKIFPVWMQGATGSFPNVVEDQPKRTEK